MTHSQGKLLVGILPALQPVYFKIEKVNFSVMYLNLPTLLLSMTKWQKFFVLMIEEQNKLELNNSSAAKNTANHQFAACTHTHTHARTHSMKVVVKVQ